MSGCAKATLHRKKKGREKKKSKRKAEGHICKSKDMFLYNSKSLNYLLYTWRKLLGRKKIVSNRLEEIQH